MQHIQSRPSHFSGAAAPPSPALVAVSLGVLMPIVALIAFPTYMHQMPHPGWEWARLLELPFVMFEIAMILYASHRGIDRIALWRQLPSDIRLAAIPFAVAIFASSLFLSQKPAATMTMSLMTVIHALFAIALYHLFTLDKSKGSSRFLEWHGWGALALLALTAWWFLTPPPPEQVMGGVIEWHAALPGFISVRHFGSWTGAIAAGFAITILFGDQKKHLDRNHFFYFLAAAMTVWSGTRAAILAIIVVFVLFMIFQRRIPSPTAIGRAALLTGLALLAAWQFRWDDPAFLLFVQGDYSSMEAAASLRSELWAIGIDRWMASPLLGWGTGSFFWEGQPHTHTQPHNVVVQMLVSWGLLGMVSGLWIIGRGIRSVHLAAAGNSWSLGMLGMMYALLLQSLLEGMLHYPRFIVTIIALGAIILARSVRDAESSATQAA